MNSFSFFLPYFELYNAHLALKTPTSNNLKDPKGSTKILENAKNSTAKSLNL